MNRHPGQDEADAVRATYKEKSCSYGDDCQTEGCLYWHPWEAAEAVDNAGYAGELSSALGGMQLDVASANGAVPTYEQWLAMNCPAPPTMDETRAYNLWHYPGSGMQRSPWEVYTLMYPQKYSSASLSSLNATSQTWDPASNSVQAAPQSWEPANNAPSEDPKTFQEWKSKGQPYPSWFCFDIDPWYGDDGVRRSLEEVYEVLYGPNAEENFALMHQAQQIASDPTPAELAAMIDSNDPVLGASPPVRDPVPAKGGWASIAAKPPAPVANGVISGAQTITRGERSASIASVDSKRQTVAIPKEVWLPSTANSECFHLYPNPIERFKAVNNHHKPYLASVTIPLSFDGGVSAPPNGRDKSKHVSKVALLDVHFQSAKTITPVLNRFLVPALKKNEEVWIVTGSGHHVAVGHQRRESGGVLFNAVKRYLEENEEEMELEFRVGKDTSGGKNKSSGGAFLVRRL